MINSKQAREKFLSPFLDLDKMEKEEKDGINVLRDAIEKYEDTGDHEKLQIILVEYMKDEHFEYLTGLGLLDASDDIVSCAREDGKIF